MRGSLPRAQGSMLVAAIGLYLLLSFLTFPAAEEDSFIYFRLAANLAEGHGYVFNRGFEAIDHSLTLPFFQPAISLVTMIATGLSLA